MIAVVLRSALTLLGCCLTMTLSAPWRAEPRLCIGVNDAEPVALRIGDDVYALCNDGFIVYHDDMGDYSTNEATMDGTASAMWLLAALAPKPYTVIPKPQP